MVFIDNISQLQYYHLAPDAPCYCEFLAYPSDLILQASYPAASGTLDFAVQLLSPDGITQLETPATTQSYFQWYFFTLNGFGYTNIRLKTYSPAMCANKCWILRVTISIKSTGQVLFDKYTERYCQASCCDVPRGIEFGEGDSLVLGTPTTPITPATDCGQSLIRVEVTFPCFDAQCGDYYAIPVGQTWGYKKITNIPGRLVERSKEITRTISYNCNLQRAESFMPYVLESMTEDGIFPYWKKRELECMFHAPEIIVSDYITQNEYQFAGGPVTELIATGSLCWELFKLRVNLQTCTIRQVFGCTPGCDNANATLKFLIPQNYGGGNFYSEDRVLIGTYADLLIWFAGQELVSSVTDITDQYDNIYAAFSVTGNSYIPTQFYFGYPSPRNRVYGVNSPSSPVVQCAMPTIGTIVVTDQICAVPTIGTIVITDQAVEMGSVNDANNWDVDEGISFVEITPTFGRLDITTFNPNLVANNDAVTYTQLIAADMASADITVPAGTCQNLTYGGSTYFKTLDFTQAGQVVTMTNGVVFSIGDDVLVGMQSGSVQPYLTNEIIGVISANARPSTGFSVALSSDITVTIDNYGNIRYTGYPTTTDGTGSEIVINDLIYPL